MITLKIRKAICPACDSKSQTERFVSGKLTALGLFFVENKDNWKLKRKLDSFLS